MEEEGEKRRIGPYKCREKSRSTRAHERVKLYNTNSYDVASLPSGVSGITVISRYIEKKHGFLSLF